MAEKIGWAGISINLGTDPELFLEQDSKIIGSEKHIPKEGIDTYCGKIVRDGVQVELHPAPTHCRQIAAMFFGHIFKKLQTLSKENNFTLSFEGVVDVEQKELGSLAAENRILGCGPSQNAHSEIDAKVEVDGEKYLVRSAGGHIHLGISKTIYPYLYEKRISMVPLLDILVGNTSVLMDPCKRAAERRKTYGRAGEYRLPDHGLEYRTLSNFWLRNYQTYSFVFGLARIATQLVFYDAKYGMNLAKSLIETVDLKDIVKAIQLADRPLAERNFQKVAKWLVETFATDECTAGKVSITKASLPFVEQFLAHDIDHWWPNDPESIIANWAWWSKFTSGHDVSNEANRLSGHTEGAERFFLESFPAMLSARSLKEAA